MRSQTKTAELSCPPGALTAPTAPVFTSTAARTLDIGVDLDGVVYDFVDALRRYIHKDTGRPLNTMPEPTSWEFYADDWGMTLEEFITFFNEGVNAGYIFYHGAPFDGVVDGIDRLLNAGHRIHIVTDRARSGRPGLAEIQTKKYLEEYGIDYTSLTISADKASVHTDVFIDDRDKNYLALVDAGVDAYMRDAPYNRHVETPAGRRVANFTEFVDALLAA